MASDDDVQGLGTATQGDIVLYRQAVPGGTGSEEWAALVTSTKRDGKVADLLVFITGEAPSPVLNAPYGEDMNGCWHHRGADSAT